MSSRFYFFLSGVTLLAIGCGQTKLTQEQKQKVGNVLNSASAAWNSAGNASKGASSVSPARPSDLFAALDTPMPKEEKDQGPSATALATQRLISAIGDGQCNPEGFLPDPEQLMGFIKNIAGSSKLEFGMKGSRCPISMGFALESKFDMPNKKASVDMYVDYSVNDGELAELVRLKLMRAQFSSSTTLTGNSSESTLSIAGTLVSVDYGNIELYGHGSSSFNQSSHKQSMVMGAKFPDFTAELEIESDGQSTKVTLNGEELDGAPVNDLLNGGV